MKKTVSDFYVITHAGHDSDGDAIKGGPYEAGGPAGTPCAKLKDAQRYAKRSKALIDSEWIRHNTKVRNARVIRITVRPIKSRSGLTKSKRSPNSCTPSSEESAMEVLRSFIAWADYDGDEEDAPLLPIEEAARRVLASAEPGPSVTGFGSTNVILLDPVLMAEKVKEDLVDIRRILDASVGESTADAAIRLHNELVDVRERAEKDATALREWLRCPKHSMHDVPKLCQLSEEQRGLERLVETVCCERDKQRECAEKAERERDALVAILVKLFAWADTSFLHAVMHVENAVMNLRADLSTAKMCGHACPNGPYTCERAAGHLEPHSGRKRSWFSYPIKACATQPETRRRATNEELISIFDDDYGQDTERDCAIAGVLAVAEHVRKEPGILEQLVASAHSILFDREAVREACTSFHSWPSAGGVA